MTLSVIPFLKGYPQCKFPNDIGPENLLKDLLASNRELSMRGYFIFKVSECKNVSTAPLIKGFR